MFTFYGNLKWEKLYLDFPAIARQSYSESSIMKRKLNTRIFNSFAMLKRISFFAFLNFRIVNNIYVYRDEISFMV